MAIKKVAGDWFPATGKNTEQKEGLTKKQRE